MCVCREWGGGSCDFTPVIVFAKGGGGHVHYWHTDTQKVCVLCVCVCVCVWGGSAAVSSPTSTYRISTVQTGKFSFLFSSYSRAVPAPSSWSYTTAEPIACHPRTLASRRSLRWARWSRSPGCWSPT